MQSIPWVLVVESFSRAWVSVLSELSVDLRECIEVWSYSILLNTLLVDTNLAGLLIEACPVRVNSSALLTVCELILSDVSLQRNDSEVNVTIVDLVLVLRLLYVLSQLNNQLTVFNLVTSYVQLDAVLHVVLTCEVVCSIVLQILQRSDALCCNTCWVNIVCSSCSTVVNQE